MGGTPQLPDGYDQAALERCIELFFGALKHPDRVAITITSEFTRVVRETVEDEDYAAAYEQDRPMAFTLAKTIELSDGTTRLIVFADLFLDDLPHGDPATTFAHEALHVNISERGETLSDLRQRSFDEEFTVHEALVGAAGVAGEEYRVERALWAQGWRQESNHLDGIDRLGRIFYNQARQACQKYQSDLDISQLAKGTLEAFHALATSTAYVAAELAHSGVEPSQVELDDELEDLVLGDAWHGVIAELQRLPPADVPASRADLDAKAFDIAASLETWFEEVGFLIRADGNGRDYFEILAPYQWALPGFEVDDD